MELLGGKVPIASLAVCSVRGEHLHAGAPSCPSPCLYRTSLPSLLAPGLATGSLVNHRLSATRSPCSESPTPIQPPSI